MPVDIQLSVAVITRDRPESLRNGLTSLRSQNLQPFEVIVSDDSGAESVEASRNVAENYGCIYCVGPHRGLYANRNFAFLQCRGTHIRTMDDDHILPSGHLVQCLEAIKKDPTAIWTTGEIGYLNGVLIDVGETANQLEPAGVGIQIDNRDDNWGIADGSTIYPRAVFDRGFRMVEDFRAGSSYLEFGAYLYQNGWKSRCIPGAMVEHHATELARPDVRSQMFASICFNHYFRPDVWRAARYFMSYWRNWMKLPDILEIARRRWKPV
jgi:glycosyltransferase involved in cell wall biosynthesis